MDLRNIDIGVEVPHDVNVIIEVPLGGEPIKYEFDKPSGALFVDRFLYTAMQYPCNYGFVPHTLSDDGDPVYAMVVGNRPLVPGAVLGARPVGVLLMEDEAGQDEKVLCVPSPRLTRYYDDVQDFDGLPAILLERISHFFEQYKALEHGKWVRILGWQGRDAAQKIILDGIQAAADNA